MDKKIGRLPVGAGERGVLADDDDLDGDADEGLGAFHGQTEVDPAAKASF
jgi:hypothetical protein